MASDFDSSKCESGFSSPPCMAHEVDPQYFDPLGVNPEQARDVARWRKAERKRLREARKALPAVDRNVVARSLMTGLRALVAERATARNGAIVSFYWPIKDEPDLRPLMAELHVSGLRIALPLVETKAAPLVFRVWTPETRMVRGVWNIPVPPRDAPKVAPDLVLAPVTGWDKGGYRLGYGGGYFDRTLAAASPRPFSIGIGLASAQLNTIYPQPHDIPLDIILTERGVEVGQP